MGGQDKPIAADLGGPLFADGPGTFLSIAALPLEEGYSTTFRNFDVQRSKVSVKRAEVKGTEDVTVPAGPFKAWKVELKSAEGEPGDQTVWIDTASRKVVKVTATLPQMGGATATYELVK
jgi:outer membrane lipoprotein-sorting protein